MTAWTNGATVASPWKGRSDGDVARWDGWSCSTGVGFPLGSFVWDLAISNRWCCVWLRPAIRSWKSDDSEMLLGDVGSLTACCMLVSRLSVSKACLPRQVTHWSSVGLIQFCLSATLLLLLTDDGAFRSLPSSIVSLLSLFVKFCSSVYAELKPALTCTCTSGSGWSPWLSLKRPLSLSTQAGALSAQGGLEIGAPRAELPCAFVWCWVSRLQYFLTSYVLSLCNSLLFFLPLSFFLSLFSLSSSYKRTLIAVFSPQAYLIACVWNCYRYVSGQGTTDVLVYVTTNDTTVSTWLRNLNFIELPSSFWTTHLLSLASLPETPQNMWVFFWGDFFNPLIWQWSLKWV